MKDSPTSVVHEHPHWYDAWCAAADSARKQYFIVDDAFVASKNCMDEVTQYKSKATKPAAFVFLGTKLPSRWSTSEQTTKDYVETTLFADTKIEKIFQLKPEKYIPKSVQPLMMHCPTSTTDFK